MSRTNRSLASKSALGLLPLMFVAFGVFGCGDKSSPGDPCATEDCSGHGTCTAADGSAICDCNTGYAGAVCDECDNGFTVDADGACVAMESCATDDPCSANGTCDDTTGVIECVCDPGYDGDFCQQCYPGYHDDGNGACVLDIECMPNSCAGHGTCDDSSGLVECSCGAGYVGDHCETCAADYHRDENDNCVADDDCSTDDPCGDYGTCDDTTGVIECVCDVGYDGPLCDTCYAGYHDDGSGACVLDEQCLANTCDSHGTCDATGGTVDCSCDAGYVGDSCETCAADYHRDANENCVSDEDCSASDPCGAHGTCVDTTGVIECVCDMGYDGQLCDTCYAGYHDDGSGACVLDEQCLANTCSGHGTCDDTGGLVSCVCATGYTGSNCQSCDADYHRDANEDCVPDEDCSASDPCGANGTCDDSSGVIQCVCDVGYTGTFCDACYPGYEVNGVTGLCEVPCSDPQWIRCNGTCVNGGDHDNCGACGNDCGGLLCISQGTFDYECGCHNYWPYERCGPTECVDKGTDTNNCGACGNVCDTGAGEICFNGNCVVEDPGCWCTGDPNFLCCSGNCYDQWDLERNENHCGDCTTVCTAGVELCIAGNCQSGDGTCGGTCDPNNALCCSGSCIDRFSFEYDGNNCGGCGIVCGANSYCNEARCTCNQGFADCGAGCIDTLTDEANCGGCGNACGAGEACVYGTCVPDNPTGCGGSCGADEFCCSLSAWPWEECVSIPSMRDDSDHCGGCDPCAPGENCNNGVCNCPYWYYGYCGGVCTDFEDVNNCGGCGIVCGPNEFCNWNGMTAQCECPWEACGGVCTNTGYDESNCGGCDISCGAGEACVAGGCVPENGTGCDASCDDNGACCDVGGAGQCFSYQDLQRAHDNCGGCGIGCTGGDVCVDGVCGPPPGDDCTSPQTTSEGPASYNLCQNTESGFVTSNCSIPGDGTQTDRFHLFTVPYDSPGGWDIQFMAGGLSSGQAEVWKATPGDYCDNTELLGCIDNFGELMLDSATAPVGSEIIIYVYDPSDPCMFGGDYDLEIHPM